MNETVRQKREKPASPKAVFIRQASHEIQGSFFGVASICAMLKMASGSKGDTEILLDHLMDACRTYKYKLSNFLEFTRFDAGLDDTILESVDLRELLNRVVHENQASAAERKVKIALYVSDDMPVQVLTDELRIAQICSNLLSNAVNFSPPGSPVSIQVRREAGDNWAIVVEDEGVGMTADELDRAFDLSAASRNALKNPGGLGLLVTRYLVEDVLKGTIALSGRSPAGTICKVILSLNEKI